LTQQQWMAIGRVLGMWTLFGVLFALVPIIFSAISEWIHGDSIALSELVGGGELLLVTTGVCAAALGELAGQPTDALRGVRGLLSGVSVIIILIAGLLFADVAGSLRDHEDFDAVRVATASVVLFSIALMTAAVAMVVAEISTWD
jgi:hypothetical protein